MRNSPSKITVIGCFGKQSINVLFTYNRSIGKYLANKKCNYYFIFSPLLQGRTYDIRQGQV